MKMKLLLLQLAALLATAASRATDQHTKNEEASSGLPTTDKRNGDGEDVLVVCSEHTMEINILKDWDKYWLHGKDPDCLPTVENFSLYDGATVPAMTWTLPLHMHGGPCGLRYEQGDSSRWRHAVKLFSTYGEKEVVCSDVDLAGFKGSIVTELLTPVYKVLSLSDRDNWEEWVVPRRAALSTHFRHNLPGEAGLSLYPIECWMEVLGYREWRVLAGGCPEAARSNNRTFAISIGTEPSTEDPAGEITRLYFNAETDLFIDAQYLPPALSLTCHVMVCKGGPLHQQVKGVHRCPSVDRCREGKMTNTTDLLKVTMPSYIRPSPEGDVIPYHLYRPLNRFYPSVYRKKDNAARAAWAAAAAAKKDADRIERLQTAAFYIMVFLTAGILLVTACRCCCFRSRQQPFLPLEEDYDYDYPLRW